VLATSLYITVYLATSIAARLRWREEQVVALSRQTKAHADELEVTCDKLAEIERAKSSYTRKVAHEMRSPLAAVESLLRVVAEGLQGDIPDRALEKIETASRRTRKLLAVTGDLLTLAAARETKLLGKCTDVDMSETLEGVVRLLAAQAESRGIAICQEVAGDLPSICGDCEGMEQLLTNLISNAIKYSKEGCTVWVRMCQRGGCVEIEVADEGIGIGEAEMDSIFEEFHRSPNAREFTSDGTGLGLSIVKSIVEAHRGSIAVRSRKGEGTTFTIRLPIGGMIADD